MFWAEDEKNYLSVAELLAKPQSRSIVRDDSGTVCVVASGPSAASESLDLCRKYATIAVNDSYRLAPWADALYACDPQWWEHHIGAVRSGFSGELWTQDGATADKHGLNWIQGHHNPGLSDNPDYIHYNSNSGAQALNLAVLWGAKRLILIGFDMKSEGSKRHWFGNHPGTLDKASDYRDWVQKFRIIARDLKKMGVQVVNCSMNSALDCFEKRPLSALEPTIS